MKKKSLKTSPSPVSLETEPRTPVPAVTNPNEPILFPVAPLREGVVFPHTETVLVFGRAASKLALEAADTTHRHIIVVSQKDETVDDVQPKHLYKMGTLARIERTLKHEDEVHVLLQGLKRVELKRFTQTEPYLEATATEVTEIFEETDEFTARLNHLTNLFKKTVQSGKPVEFFNFMKLISGTRTQNLVDHIASTLDLETAEKQSLLEELDVNQRIERVTEFLSREQHILDIEQKISNKTKKKLDERMRESILRERLQVIQRELGELGGEDEDAELNELQEQLDSTKLPDDVRKKVEKEMRRLSQMSPAHAEYTYISNWVETILSLPWSKQSRSRTSLQKAAKVLDQQHFGLEKVKERILEHLAVLQLHNEQQKAGVSPKNGAKPKRTHLSTILCFVGPPGVGKTSIGRSIAEALGREFVKVSLGGVHDEAEIRGHRRTYVGAMPGRIVQGLIQAKTKNPVFVLDEVDKLGNDFRGDPSAALLEALDPEQNGEFQDHYLGVPFDLSEVMFITTANVLHTIPSALRDRLEIVEYSGYTYDEKFHIAKQYLVDQVSKGAALVPGQLTIKPDALRQIIREYTREAGVRSLKRELSKLARKAARSIADSADRSAKVVITVKNVDEFLGPPKFLDMSQEKSPEVGLVNGLAWTSVGGEILPIEVAIAPGKEGFTLTGQLGDVMKESAHAAYTYVRSKATELGIEPELFEKSRVHIHAPEGAVPKDGPSAGIALTTALTSVFTQRPVRHDLAMTGEVTLRGRVLPIGGLKEKLIAAHRAGMKTVIIPEQNVKDLVEVPKNVREDLEILAVDQVRKVLDLALLPAPSSGETKKKTRSGSATQATT